MQQATEKWLLEYDDCVAVLVNYEPRSRRIELERGVSGGCVRSPRASAGRAAVRREDSASDT